MQLELSHRAYDDIEDIGDYIARDSQAAANAFVDRIWSEFAVILRSPLAFRIAEDLPSQGVRTAHLGRYRILFRTQGDVVRIERVIHGMRDLPRHVK